MREYVGIPARKTCNLQTFAFLIVDLGAGVPGSNPGAPTQTAWTIHGSRRLSSWRRAFVVAAHFARRIRSNPAAPSALGRRAVSSPRHFEFRNIPPPG